MRALLVLAAALPLWAASPNITQWKLANGTLVEVEWLTTSSLRIQRCFRSICPSRPAPEERVGYTLTPGPTGYLFKTEYLTVEVERLTGLPTIRATRGGTQLFQETKATAQMAWRAQPSEQFYGLGPRADAELSLRGQTIQTTRPFLLSSLGYALFFGVPGPYRFELGLQPAATGPFNDRLEYFFYYGPTPKETLSEHLVVTGNINPISPRYVDGSGRLPPYGFELPAGSLPELVRQLHHASLSAMLVPVVNASRFDTPLNLFWPVVHGKPLPERSRWLPYFYTYLKESHDRGIPMFRPLAFQYPENAAFWKQAGAFMIGDELLFSIDPKITLPRGIWTNFCTGESFGGRKTIDTPAGACPLVHNGTIIPLATGKDLIELHYFPRLGAEFFIAEPGFDMPTQVHASPAGEYLRLESESLVTREFEWVVHQVSKPVKVEPVVPFQYDAAKRTLRVRVKAPADSDIIVNINLEEPL